MDYFQGFDSLSPLHHPGGISLTSPKPNSEPHCLTFKETVSKEKQAFKFKTLWEWSLSQDHGTKKGRKERREGGREGERKEEKKKEGRKERQRKEKGKGKFLIL